jgi:flagellar M-ring protein FliF
MPEQLQKWVKKIQDWWKGFDTRQKAVAISLVAVVVVAFSILGYVVSRPNMIQLRTCVSAEEASTVKDLLEGEDISYTTSDDGMTYYIRQEDEASANILLGTNDIPSDGYTIEDVLDGSFSTTEADKTKKYQLYLEEKFADSLETLSNVSSADVTLSIPEDDGTLISQNQDAYASVILKLNQDMDAEQAEGIAKYIATELGNDTTDNILILDGDGNVLFSGGSDTTTASKASDNQSVRQQAENYVKSEVKSVILGTNVYDNVEVAMNLVMDFDQESSVDYHYYVDDGQTQGYLGSRSESSTESTTGVQGVPGTDSNDDDTTYVLDNSDTGTSSSSEVTENYFPSETITNNEKEVGTVSYDDSSISVVAASYVVYNEETLEKNGTLDDMTFDEFVEQNSQRVKTDVDEDFYSMVSNATGIPQENISIVAYEIPMFQYAEGSGRTVTDYLQIILAVLIFAMLGFVVLRTLRGEQEEDTVETEVSVESLLEAQQEAPLEDIGFSEKSEARVLIEKFVDDKPEAVAALLRNWLNDDWG